MGSLMRCDPWQHPIVTMKELRDVAQGLVQWQDDVEFLEVWRHCAGTRAKCSDRLQRASASDDQSLHLLVGWMGREVFFH
eukprot:m.517832 g.517832  ORF g.517832 m.517832 type:complete len:80 (+) comp57482_c0_seq4:84-323(+)